MDGREATGGLSDHPPNHGRNHPAMYQDTQFHPQPEIGTDSEDYRKEKNSHMNDKNHEYPRRVSVQGRLAGAHVQILTQNLRKKQPKPVSKEEDDVARFAELLNEAISDMNKRNPLLTAVAKRYESNKSKNGTSDNKGSKKAPNKGKKDTSQRNTGNNLQRGPIMNDMKNSRDSRRLGNQKQPIDQPNPWPQHPQGHEMTHHLQYGLYQGYPEDYLGNPAYLHEFQNPSIYYPQTTVE